MWVSTPASYSTMSGLKQVTTEGRTSPKTLLHGIHKSAAAETGLRIYSGAEFTHQPSFASPA